MKFLNEDHKAFKPVAKTRETIAALQGELEELERAPLPEDEALARVKAWIDRARDSGGYHLASWATVPETQSQSGPNGYPGWMVGGDTPQADLLKEMTRVMTWVCPDLIEEACLAEIRRRLETNPPGPPMAERPSLRRKAQADLMKAEIAEEQAIESLEAEGWLVHRRPDSRPEVILGEVAA